MEREDIERGGGEVSVWGSEMEERERDGDGRGDMDSSTLTAIHIGNLRDNPRPDGAVLAVSLTARDVAVGVRAGSAVARPPGDDAPSQAEVPLQLRLCPRRKRRLDRERSPHRGQQREDQEEGPERKDVVLSISRPCYSVMTVAVVESYFNWHPFRTSILAGGRRAGSRSTQLCTYLLRPPLPLLLLLRYKGMLLLLVCAHTCFDRETTVFVQFCSDDRNGMVTGKTTKGRRGPY